MVMRDFFKGLSLLVTILLLSGCGRVEFMKSGELLKQAGSDEVLVTIVRPSSVQWTGNVGIWDADRFLGLIKNKEFVQYKTAPGKHKFVSQAANWSLCEADFLPGKHYVIVVHTWPHFGKGLPSAALNHIQHYVEKNAQPGQTAETTVKEWLATYSSVKVDDALASEYVAARKNDVLVKVKEMEKLNYAVIKSENHL